jgi:hypothetical protein
VLVNCLFPHHKIDIGYEVHIAFEYHMYLDWIPVT